MGEISQKLNLSISRTQLTLLHSANLSIRINSAAIFATLLLRCSLSSRTSIQTDLCVSRFATKNTYKASQVFSEIHLSGVENQNEHIQQQLPTNKSLLTNTLERYCRPKQVISVLRHGIRYPSTDHVENVSDLLERLQTAGADPTKILPLKDVVAELSKPGKAEQLSKTGAMEQFDLGERTASRFRHFLHSDHKETTESQIVLVSSSVQRAIDSAHSFYDGLQSVLGSRNSASNVSIRDDLLRFFDFCPKYLEQVTNNKSALIEFIQFRKIIVADVGAHIAKHFSIPPWKMSVDEMMSLYTLMASEVAILDSRNFFSLLSDRLIQLLEYAADIKNYWKLGYGYEINYAQSCPIIKDMFSHMDEAIRQKSHIKGVFYFGHAETVVPVMSLLSLFRDSQPLRSDNYQQHINRQFRTSNISPFSANVGFVLYECDADTITHSNSLQDESLQLFFGKPARHMVALTVKESPVIFPFCNKYLCAYETLRNKFGKCNSA